MPEKIWKEQRLADLRIAIQERVKMQSHPVPAEWIDEFNRLLVEVHGEPTKICLGKPGEETKENTFFII